MKAPTVAAYAQELLKTRPESAIDLHNFIKEGFSNEEVLDAIDDPNSGLSNYLRRSLLSFFAPNDLLDWRLKRIENLLRLIHENQKGR